MMDAYFIHRIMENCVFFFLFGHRAQLKKNQDSCKPPKDGMPQDFGRDITGRRVQLMQAYFIHKIAEGCTWGGCFVVTEHS